jgi:DNA-directed RNA polymerase sigma subunit (sigma70/sigma32)
VYILDGVNSYQREQSYAAMRRADQMRRYRERGWTLERIGTKYGVTKQRVHQILNTASQEETK